MTISVAMFLQVFSWKTGPNCKIQTYLNSLKFTSVGMQEFGLIYYMNKD